MLVSARGRLILEKLLVSSFPISIDTMAKTLGVSSRTIRRDLDEITSICTDYDLKLIIRNNTLSIDGLEKNIQTFKWHLFDLSYSEFTPLERQNFILKQLIKSNDTLTITSLANELNVTESTIRADLLKIKDEYGQSIKIDTKRGTGISLIATEIEKRTIIRNMVHNTISTPLLVQFLYQNDTDTNRLFIKDRLLGLIDDNRLIIVDQELKKWHETQEYKLADESYFTLLVHVSIAVERIKEQELVKVYDTNIEDIVESDEYQDAIQILSNIMDTPQTDLPENEIIYVAQYLRSAKLKDSHHLIERDTMRATNLAQKLIHRIQNDLDYHFNDETLLKGLITHLRSALRRLDQNMMISNPLIDSIKEEHGLLFNTISKAVEDIFVDIYVNEDEIGYLVLHFGAAIIQSQKKKFSCLIVCSSGIGTSKMLLTRIQKTFPQFSKLKTTSVFDVLQRDDHQLYDIIISTLDLGNVNFDYLLVSPILSNQDIENITSHLSLMNVNSLRYETPQSVSLNEAMDYFETLSKTSTLMSQLIEDFEVRMLTVNSNSIEDYIRAMCLVAMTQSESEPELVVKSMLNGGHKNSFAIPNTHLAFFHERSAGIKKSTLKVFPLTQPIQILGLDNRNHWVNTFILLLAPEKLEQYELELLSFTSSLIIDNEEAPGIFEMGDQNEITTYLVSRYRGFIQKGV
ncbi:hypothetical protein AOC36_04930 [Erysipelothrix larvae]|uniref:Uncharacterized protein n=1 Tax=Erysipelothrix larvae TaxID=1514105 RepID=A0A0X8GZK5_9FIRM|nr:BglG family transcription antiterminator [Erysipelothrix larvae]AMC93342.1 hypothetical protein AOC36_04930 [Erysipelothrix larvae]